MKWDNLWNLLAIALVFSLAACSEDNGDAARLEITYNFAQSQNGWTGDFADYPVGEEEFYELDFAYDALPAPLDTTQKALKVTGNNHSDDLFFFVKKKVTGLAPNREFELHFDVEIAHNAPEESAGVGGSPGASNYLKVGASGTEPVKVDRNGFYELNLDKGNQSQSGDDAIVIGNIGHEGDEFVYQLMQRDNDETTFTARSNANGELWVFLGVDSGFEGLTTFYVTNVKIEFK